MTPDGTEARWHNHAVQLLQIHEALLKDGARNRPFYEALKKVVTSDSTVLDIGSGTGLWAITAARLGAKKVVAIEREPLLIGLIKTLAQANGVADQVEVIQGDSRQIGLAREFDIVISETIGHVIFDEQIVSIMADARERFLKPGGMLIPDAVTLVAAPARLRQPGRLPVEIDLAYGKFESLIRNIPVGVTDKKDLTILGEPRVLIAVDLNQATSDPMLDRLTAKWHLTETGEINCFAVWAEMTMGEGISVSTMETSSWSATAYRIRPFAGAEVETEFQLTLTTQSNFWTVGFLEGTCREVQSYSPSYAANELLAPSGASGDGFESVRPIGVFSGDSIFLRPATPADEDFLRQVYAGSRAEELAAAPWTVEQREAFLRMQFNAQHQDYHKNYPAASYQIILSQGIPVGRLYVDRREKEIHILDIALLSECRNAGIGSEILRNLIEESEAVGKPLTIYVEKFNRALHLYQRLDFVPMEEGPIYFFMQRSPVAPKNPTAPA